MKIDNNVEFKISENLVDYDSAIEFMNSHINKMKKNQAKEILWFLEHNSIFTAGTSAKEIDQNIKNKNLIRYVGRGGQWTWHGPGQRVVYVMLDLKQREKDIKKYINNLELIFKIIHPNKAIVADKNNSNLEITRNLIIWNLNQGQINSLEFSFWSLNKLLIGISIILIIIILAYLLRFYRLKLGSDLPQLPSK